MSITHLRSVALNIPEKDVKSALSFYEAFGLKAKREDGFLSLYCDGEHFPAIKLIVSNKTKSLHHVCLGTNSAGMERIKQNIKAADLSLEGSGYCETTDGIWFRDPCGIQYNVCISTRPDELHAKPPVMINSPGHRLRINKGALPPKSEIPAVVPLRLGHCLLFTSDVLKSVDFVERILGMKLSDRADDVVAFTHCQGGSDHHVVAFAKSSGTGFHHASFQVATPDCVGLGGTRMAEQGYERGWGFGRHSIGSNFFYYVRDPWGSYLEYYCDMDYIADSDSWEATNWPLEDSLHSWGPNPPADFVHNYEVTV